MTDPKKLRWQCRRGMLELDLLLLPFFENHYSQLSEENKENFVRLIANTDQDLYAWLVKGEPPQDSSLIPILKQILHARSSTI
jgi:antitoxin CptB